MTDELMKGAGDASLEALYRQHIATPAQTKGCVCQNCNKAYETDMLVPDDVWERIKPEGGDVGAGLLCPTCIMDRTGWPVGFVYPDRRGPELVAGKPAQTKGVSIHNGTVVDALGVPVAAQTKGDDLAVVGYEYYVSSRPGADRHCSSAMPDERFISFPAQPLVRLSEAAPRIQSLTASNEALERERDELVAANNAIEIDAGLTSDGNLWRFWAKKASDVSGKRKAAQAEIARMREALERIDKQPESFDGPDRCYGVGYAFHLVKNVARHALTPQEPK